MSHSWTSSFDYHLDNSFVIFKDVHFGIALTRKCVTGHVIHLMPLLHITGCLPFSVVLLLSLEASILLRLAEAAMEGFLLV